MLDHVLVLHGFEATIVEIIFFFVVIHFALSVVVKIRKEIFVTVIMDHIIYFRIDVLHQDVVQQRFGVNAQIMLMEKGVQVLAILLILQI